MRMCVILPRTHCRPFIPPGVCRHTWLDCLCEHGIPLYLLDYRVLILFMFSKKFSELICSCTYIHTNIILCSYSIIELNLFSDINMILYLERDNKSFYVLVFISVLIVLSNVYTIFIYTCIVMYTYIL
jgi:hypothetical protein